MTAGEKKRISEQSKCYDVRNKEMAFVTKCVQTCYKRFTACTSCDAAADEHKERIQ